MIFLTAFLVLSLQAASIMPDSLALPIPDGARIAEDCDSMVIDRLAPGARFDPASGDCLTVDMARYHEVLAALDLSMDEAGFELRNRQDMIASLYARREPLSGCRELVMVAAAPPSDGPVRPSSEPELRPFDGQGLLLFMLILPDGCEP